MSKRRWVPDPGCRGSFSAGSLVSRAARFPTPGLGHCRHRRLPHRPLVAPTPIPPDLLGADLRIPRLLPLQNVGYLIGRGFGGEDPDQQLRPEPTISVGIL